MSAGLANKDFSAKELFSAHAEAVRSDRLNTFITKTLETAELQAIEADRRIAAGEAVDNPLCGIPIVVKDAFCIKNVRMTAASRMLENFIAPYDSHVTAALDKKGTVMLGKTNMDEFCMGSATRHSYFGDVLNPWRNRITGRHTVPGGSSGGSAAAVAGYLAPVSLGTDTGGSVRQPASLCGLVGVKPTYGRCSRYGMTAFASSLDHPGVFSRTVEDGALMLGAIAGHDVRDATSVNIPVPDYAHNLQPDVKGLRIGIPGEYMVEGLSDDVRRVFYETVEHFKRGGAELTDVNLPHSPYALSSYYVIALAEAASNLARYDGIRYGLREDRDTIEALYCATRGLGFGEEVKRRIIIGTYVLRSDYVGSYYKLATKIRELIKKDFKAVFNKVDLLVAPVNPSVATDIADRNDVDVLREYAEDILTVPANMAGIPALAVPVNVSSAGLPIGLQIMGNYFDEQKMFNCGLFIEKAVAFEQWRRKMLLEE